MYPITQYFMDEFSDCCYIFFLKFEKSTININRNYTRQIETTYFIYKRSTGSHPNGYCTQRSGRKSACYSCIHIDILIHAYCQILLLALDRLIYCSSVKRLFVCFFYKLKLHEHSTHCIYKAKKWKKITTFAWKDVIFFIIIIIVFNFKI